MMFMKKCGKLQLVVNKENYDKCKVLFENRFINILKKKSKTFSFLYCSFTVMFLQVHKSQP